jgi:hypothetical protein
MVNNLTIYAFNIQIHLISYVSNALSGNLRTPAAFDPQTILTNPFPPDEATPTPPSKEPPPPAPGNPPSPPLEPEVVNPFPLPPAVLTKPVRDVNV